MEEFRGIERLLIVIGAIISIVLGYRLFSTVPAQTSSGDFRVLSAKVVLTKVGPGVFFALFGTFVLWQALSNVFKTPGGSYIVAPPPASPEDQVRAAIAAGVLNCLGRPDVAPRFGSDDRVEQALIWSKIALVLNAWVPEWGPETERLRVRREGTPTGPAKAVFDQLDRDCPK